MRWLLNLWYWRQRGVDLEILWPICKQKAPNLDMAKTMFALHALSDPAWLCLGEAEMERRIDQLV